MKGLKRVSNGSASIYKVSTHALLPRPRHGLHIPQPAAAPRAPRRPPWLCQPSGPSCPLAACCAFRRVRWWGWLRRLLVGCISPPKLDDDSGTSERPREHRTKAVRHRPRRSSKRFKVKVGLAGLPQGPLPGSMGKTPFPWLSHGPSRPRTAGPAVWTTILNACCDDSPPAGETPKNRQRATSKVLVHAGLATLGEFALVFRSLAVHGHGPTLLHM